ncbi:MAG: endonuclease domain-containing protein [Bacteroidota bacterium]
MERIFNRKDQTETRRMLRNHATVSERILWSKLKSRQILGYKFRRQHGIGPYIVDFYCPELELAIEIDGETHSTAAELEYDSDRQRSIEGHGIRFLRFTNKDVTENLNHVLITIANKVREKKD